LPNHNNAKYIIVKEGDYFGFSDIIGCIITNENINIDNWIQSKD